MNLSIYLSTYFLPVFFFMFCSSSIEQQPDVITEKVAYDSDDPAVWINKEDPSQSIIFGTDKDSKGAVFAFNLKGEIIREKSIFDLKRPNNVDIRYNFRLNDSTRVDILAFTERERKQVRFFSLPDMRPLDNGGIPVFKEETKSGFSSPMGISLYSSPLDDEMYVIISRKNGPKENYLHQYKLESSNDKIILTSLRKFGKFSGKKEIEAIAVDDELGYIYYSDEKHCIRKYYAEPSKGNEELDCFGGKYFREDIEGIAITAFPGGAGYIIVSNQQKGTFNFFSRESNKFIKEIDLGTDKTDGCEVIVGHLNSNFPNGLFVAMNDDRNFYFYDLEKLGISPVTP